MTQSVREVARKIFSTTTFFVVFVVVKVRLECALPRSLKFINSLLTLHAFKSLWVSSEQ